MERIAERHADGTVHTVWAGGPAALATSVGRLTPRHAVDGKRHTDKPVITFHQNGRLRSLPLQSRTVVATPAGPLPAELVTFHDNGAVARVFPLNGKLSAYWTEADEGRLAEVLRVRTPLGDLAARFVAVAFDRQGRLKSLTLWPGEEIGLRTPCGHAPVRLGLSFHPDGSLRSLEPGRPLEVSTPAGSVWAYDPDAVGICGDDNSLAFTPSGAVRRVATIGSSLTVRLPDGRREEVAPLARESLCGDGDLELTPLVLEFTDDAVIARHGPAGPIRSWSRAGASFGVRPFVAAFAVPLAPKQCSM